MKIKEIFDIYNLISDGVSSVSSRNGCVVLRKIAMDMNTNGKLSKKAFDTRRIDQEKQFNPRRGLQNYHRSEPFISKATAEKLDIISKLKSVLEDIKEQYESHFGWQESYVRVLLSTVNKTLRIDQKDGDFSDSQPSTSSIDYLEELIYTRYRLSFENIEDMSEAELRKAILAKDDSLFNDSHKNNFTELSERFNSGFSTKAILEKKEKEIKKEIDEHDSHRSRQISRSDVANNSYDGLIEKLFGNVKATKENPNIERTITITIKDKLVDSKESEAKETKEE
jgi:hypothetical protein